MPLSPSIESARDVSTRTATRIIRADCPVPSGSCASYANMVEQAAYVLRTARLSAMQIRQLTDGLYAARQLGHWDGVSDSLGLTVPRQLP